MHKKFSVFRCEPRKNDKILTLNLNGLKNHDFDSPWKKYLSSSRTVGRTQILLSLFVTRHSDVKKLSSSFSCQICTKCRVLQPKYHLFESLFQSTNITFTFDHQDVYFTNCCSLISLVIVTPPWSNRCTWIRHAPLDDPTAIS